MLEGFRYKFGQRFPRGDLPLLGFYQGLSLPCQEDSIGQESCIAGDSSRVKGRRAEPSVAVCDKVTGDVAVCNRVTGGFAVCKQSYWRVYAVK